jgi:hypothetical protein
MAQGSTARAPVGYQVAYLGPTRLEHDSTFDAFERIKMGTIPAGSQILACYCGTKEAFDGSAADVITVGTNGSTANNIANSTDFAETTVGGTQALRGGGLTFASDTDVYAKYVQTGTAATEGIADITLAYVLDNDGE